MSEDSVLLLQGRLIVDPSRMVLFYLACYTWFHERESHVSKLRTNSQVRILQMDVDFRTSTWRQDMVNSCKRPKYHKAR